MAADLQARQPRRARAGLPLARLAGRSTGRCAGALRVGAQLDHGGARCGVQHLVQLLCVLPEG